jgi:predicted amidophosphoribosyltransferase
LARAAAPLITTDTLVVPVPLHWRRSIKRRFNQSIMLSQRISQVLNVEHCPNALRRIKATRVLSGVKHAERTSELKGAIVAHPTRGAALLNRHILLVDDFMVTGLTLRACAEACLGAGASEVSIVTLAVVAQDG